MGLDSVELLLEVEETFDISIPDEEVCQISTVGELHKSILEKMRTKGSLTGCGTQKSFYKLRRTLTNCFADDRCKIRTHTPTEEIFPLTNRKKLWKQFRQNIDLRIPDLQRPSWLICVLGVPLICLLVVLLLKLCVLIGWQWGIASTFLVFILLLYLLTIATRPLAVVFPSDSTTLGKLARSLLRMNFAKITQGEHTDSEAWNILCSIIAEQIGVKPEVIKPESSFVKDLHLD